MELLSLYPDNVTPVPQGRVQAAGGGQSSRGLGLEGSPIGQFVERNGGHAVSDDTNRVYFYDQGAVNFLYVRDLVSDPQRTIAVSASTRTGDVGTVYGAGFISASHNGSQAYFVSDAQLTDAATPGGGIYRFDLASQSVTQITPDAGDPTGLNLGGAIASDDQSHIYFTSTSALAPGAQAGTGNVYVWTQKTDEVRFIGAVDSADRFQRVSPDGRFAVMQTTTSIDGAPNNGRTAVYRYDYVSDTMVCVSCRPDGSPSEGDAVIDGQSYGQAAGPLTRTRAMTLDGRVAFMSTDRLVQADQTSAQDVYLYDSGTVSLLTAGRGDSNSYVGDISDDGKNISVITRSALVAADRDADEYDVYDIRVNGGWLAPPPKSDPCRGDDCQGPAAPTPPLSEPSSSRVTSPGNVPPAKAVKKFSVTKLTSAQRSTLARTGKVALTVRVTGGGTVSLRGRGRVAGSTKTVGSVREVVLKKAETTVKVTFRLSTSARRELSRRHRLSFTLQTRLSGLSKVASTTIKLTGANR
jgi:Tol biopolymer transport system component